MKVQFRDGARLEPGGATRRQGNADLRSAQPAAGGRQGRTPSRGGSPLGRDLGVQRHPGGYVVHAFRSLRAAVPTRGRRSLASGAIWTVGVPGGAAFSSNWAAWVSPQAANTGNVAPPSGYHRGTWSAQTLGTVRLPPASPGAAAKPAHRWGSARPKPPRSGHRRILGDTRIRQGRPSADDRNHAEVWIFFTRSPGKPQLEGRRHWTRVCLRGLRPRLQIGTPLHSLRRGAFLVLPQLLL